VQQSNSGVMCNAEIYASNICTFAMSPARSMHMCSACRNLYSRCIFLGSGLSIWTRYQLPYSISTMHCSHSTHLHPFCSPDTTHLAEAALSKDKFTKAHGSTSFCYSMHSGPKYSIPIFNHQVAQGAKQGILRCHQLMFRFCGFSIGRPPSRIQSVYTEPKYMKALNRDTKQRARQTSPVNLRYQQGPGSVSPTEPL
jgi:hypothetical protein